MSYFVSAAIDALQSVVSFADYRRVVAEGARPMECSPLVNSSGYFSSFRMEAIIRGIAAECITFESQRGMAVPCASKQDFVMWVRNRLLSSSEDTPNQYLLPSDILHEDANRIAAMYFGAGHSSPILQAQILHENIAYIKSFSIENIDPNVWSPELVFVAAIHLIGEDFWAQQQLPLCLLVLPLWVVSAGRTGNKLPESEEDYIDQVVRQWLVRCTRRGNQGLDGIADLQTDLPGQQGLSDHRSGYRAPHRRPRKRTNKFSYIQEESQNMFRVMSLPDVTINGNLRGNALMDHVIAVLRDVSDRETIPRRPKSRFRSVAQRLEKLRTLDSFFTISAQLLLRNCEKRLVPDPRALMSHSAPLNVLKLIWLISRRNIPTIITVPRFTMCALSSDSLWYELLSTVNVPPRAVLGFPGSILNGLARVSGRLGAADASGEVNVAELTSHLQILEAGSVQVSVVLEEGLRLLGCDSIETGILAVDAMYSEAKAFAIEVSTAIQCLRDHRLLREDILAHASNAWGSVMGCVRACACLYAALCRKEMSVQLSSSYRQICNHFAPDIYPWAHAISLCHGHLSGYAVCGTSNMEDLNVRIVAISAPDTLPMEEIGQSARSFTVSVAVPSEKHIVASSIMFPNARNVVSSSTKIVSRVVEGDTVIYNLSVCVTEESECDYRRGAYRGAPPPSNLGWCWEAEQCDERVQRRRTDTSDDDRLWDIEVGREWNGTIQVKVVHPQPGIYTDARSEVLRNLNPTMKSYVLSIVKNCSASVPTAVRSAETFEKLVEAWDQSVPNAMDSTQLFVVSDEAIAAAMGGETRPPCSGFLDIDAPDGLAAAVQRFSQEDLIRIMCCLGPGGRHMARISGVSDRPSAMAMVWAVLRGVNDHDWVKRYAVSSPV